MAFDVVVVDRVDGLRGSLATLLDLDSYIAFVDQHNQRAWVTISAFGLTGDRAADVATELTVAAAGGMLASVRDERTGQPMKVAGQQSLLNTGQAGALAACHAVDLAAEGEVVHLDLSAVEATIAMGPTLEVGNLLLQTGSPGGAKRYGAPASFYECSDGFIRVSAMEDHQWQGMVEAMGSPAWAERFATVEARIEAADDVDELVADWTRSLSKSEAESAAPVARRPRDSHELAVRAPRLRTVAHTETRSSACRSVTAAMRRWSVCRTAWSREATQKGPVSGVAGRCVACGCSRRVACLPFHWRAPCSAPSAPRSRSSKTCRRMDMYRRRGPYIDGEAGMERSAYFALVNHSKRSAAFDVDAERSKARRSARSVRCRARESRPQAGVRRWG